MKRALALAAILSFFGTSAMAECAGHVSASAPAPVEDQQVSTSSTSPTATTAADDGTVLSAQTETTAPSVPVTE